MHFTRWLRGSHCKFSLKYHSYRLMRLVDMMREKLIFGAFLQFYMKSYLRIFSDTFTGINDSVIMIAYHLQ
jgi:hypothetical protein